MYAVWVKVDDTLPWLELEGNYETRRVAEKAAKGLLGNLMVKIVRVGEKRKTTNEGIIILKQLKIG